MRWKMIGLVVACAVLLGVGIYFRRPAVKTTTETRATAVRDTTTVARGEVGTTEAVRSARRTTTVRESFRPDGTLARRTIVRDQARERHDKEEQVRTEVVTKEVEKIVTVTRTDTVPVKSALGLEVTAEWSRLQLQPSGYVLQADVPIVWNIRAGPQVRWKHGGLRPEAYGVTLRIEF